MNVYFAFKTINALYRPKTQAVDCIQLLIGSIVNKLFFEFNEV